MKLPLALKVKSVVVVVATVVVVVATAMSVVIVITVVKMIAPHLKRQAHQPVLLEDPL
jgi:hypothetical protein